MNGSTRFVIRNKSEKSKMIALFLPEPLQSDIRAAAKATGVPIVEVVRQCVQFAWEHLKDDKRASGGDY